MATQAEIAQHLGLSARSIRELVARGVLPSVRRGMLQADACRVAYIRHLREVAAGRVQILREAEAEALGIIAEKTAAASE